MAESIILNIDTDGSIDEALQALRNVQGGAKEAIVRALNRTSAGLKEYAGEEVSKVFVIPPKGVKSLMKATRATVSNTNAVVSREGPGLFASKFPYDANQDPGVRGGRAVYLRPRQSGGGTLLDAEGSKSKAFVSTMRNSRTGVRNSRGSVFRRTSSNRIPLEKPYGPSVPEMLAEPSVRSAVEQRTQARLVLEFDREIQALLKKSEAAQ